MTQFQTILAIFVAAGLPAVAQVTSMVGPSPAPLGTTIAITIANDTPAIVTSGSPCPYLVFDAQGTFVFQPTCVQHFMPIGVGGVLSAFWPQTDMAGQQVPPGTYVIHVLTPSGGLPFPPFPSVQHTVVIDATVDANLMSLGPLRPGVTRQILVTAPTSPGFVYAMALSWLPASGIATCGGVVPLSDDALLSYSIQPGTPLQNFVGVLDPIGLSLAPQITIPNDPALSGFAFAIAFVVLDFNGACPFRNISEPNALVIL